MTNLFSRTFHCFWLPSPNLLPPKPSSQTLPFSPSISLHRRFFTSISTHHTHKLPNSTSSSTPVPPEHEEFDVISSTQRSDGSVVFTFGNASEIREMIAELNKQKLVSEGVVEEGGVVSDLMSDGVQKLSNEDDSNLGEEIESSSTVLVAVADQNLQLIGGENESSVVVLDSYTESETPVINDSRRNDSLLKLDSVEDGGGQHVICSEDVAAERDVVPSVSNEDSQVDSRSEVAVSTVVELSSGASAEVEEKEVDNGRGVDRAANSPAGGVDASDLTELVQASTSLESNLSVNGTTNNLTGSVDADIRDLEPVSTSLESEQDDYSAADNLTGSVDADVAELVPLSTSLETEQDDYSATENLTQSVDAETVELEPVSTSSESEQVGNSTTDDLAGTVDANNSELVPVSTSSESEQVDYSATNNLAGSIDADNSELVPVSTSLESELVDYSATDDLAGGFDADNSELVPVSNSLESEQVDYSATDDLAGSVDADNSELVPVSTSLESEQVDYSATDDLAGGFDADNSELVPVSTSLESEQVDYSATDDLAGGVNADNSELVPVSTSLESEQVDYSATNDLADSVDADNSELVPLSTSLESEQVDYKATDDLAGGVDADNSELVPISTSLESEQVDYSATNDLAGSVDADNSEVEPEPASTSLESEQVDCSATDDLASGVDAANRELVPLSTSLESEQDYSATDGLAGSVDNSISELVPVSTSLDSEQSVNRETNHLTGGVDAEFSELVPISTSLESEQVDYSALDNLTDSVDADISELVPISTSLEPSQVDYNATNSLTGGVDTTDVSELAPVSTSLESEFHGNDDETSHDIVDDSADASKMEKSALLHDLVPSSDLDKEIDVGNTEISDYENPSLIDVPEIHSVEMASDGEKSSRTELLLVYGAACFPHPFEELTNREDAYFISPHNWLVVADGVGQWSLEGSNTGVYIRELMEKCENIVSNHENISTIKPAEVLIRSAAETQSPGSSSVLVAYFDGQALHAANVGNTGFIIIRDGSIFKISNAMFHEFSFPIHIVKGDDHSEIIEEYKIDLHDGDVIVFATNGLFDNLYEQEIASTISKSLQAGLKPQEIAEILATRAQDVGRSRSTRSPFGDAAQALGYVGYAGGKLDDVTVIVSLVQTT